MFSRISALLPVVALSLNAFAMPQNANAGIPALGAPVFNTPAANAPTPAAPTPASPTVNSPPAPSASTVSECPAGHALCCDTLSQV